MDSILNFNIHNGEQNKILVIGDIMLDTYAIGEVDRIYPESPVPVINYSYSKESLGGSGNVVRSLLELKTDVILTGAAGSVVGKFGTAPLSLSEIQFK